MAVPTSRGLLGAIGQDARRSDEPGITKAPPAYQLESGALRTVYLDLLGRPPFAAERERWLGLGRIELLRELVGSVDHWRAWVEEQLYYFLLIRNFRPESDGVKTLPQDLTDGRLGVIDALHNIAISPAFEMRNPGADTFVTVVMEQLLGIEVQKRKRDLEIGKTLYDGGRGVFLGVTGESQADVVRIAIEDDRCPRQFFLREYARILRAEPPKRDLKRWAREVRTDHALYPSLLRDWMLSPTWESRVADRRPQPNRMFVKSLFVDLFDRLPDDEERRTMSNALDGLGDPGPLRSVLARLLIDSDDAPVPKRSEIDDPTSWVRGLFERLLGRSPTDPELSTFVSTYHDSSVEPATVLYAIMSHPEYHRY